MSTSIRWRRGTSTQHAAFTGLDSEVTVNTTTKDLHIHDGATVGGFPVANRQLHLDPVRGDAVITVPTNTGVSSYSFKNTSKTAHDIYVALNGPLKHYDGVQSVVDVLSGSDVEHATAVAGYMRNASPAGSPTNGVAVFGLATAVVDGAAVWGVNTLLQDADNRAVGTGTGRILLGAEFDFNVMNPATNVIGVSVGGNGLSQPNSANAFIVNSLEGLSTAGAVKWSTGFWSQDGCADIGLVIGAKHKTGANLPSQDIWVNYRKGDGTATTIAIAAQAGGFLTVNKDGNADFTAFYVKGGNIQVDSGKTIIVGTNGVVGARKTGWTAGTGSPARGAFDATFTQTINSTYSQTQVQAINDVLVATRSRLLALETDIRAHGLIGA